MGQFTADEYSLLKNSKLYQGIESDVLQKTIEGAFVRNLKHREYLYTAGGTAESFSIVLSGAIKLVRPTVRGENIIVHIATVGEVIGALLMGHDKIMNYLITAKSMGPSKVLCIPRSTFQTNWKMSAQLQGNLSSTMYSRMNNLQDDKTYFAAPLKTRLVMLLLRYLDQSEAEMPGVITLPLTRQELADSLGVAVESVIRIMSEWIHLGLIRSQSQTIEIIALDKLIKSVEL